MTKKVELYEGAIRWKGYEPIDLLSDNGFSSHVVFLSEKEGKKYVFKFPNVEIKNNQLRISDDEVDNLRKEAKLLRDLVYFCGVPIIREYFDCQCFNINPGNRCENCTRSFSPLFIIKDYIEGDDAGVNNKVKGENNRKILVNLVNSIHFMGYANLDLLHKGNVIIDKIGSPWITDLSSAKKIGEELYGQKINREKFIELVRNDRFDLFKLIG